MKCAGIIDSEPYDKLGHEVEVEVADELYARNAAEYYLAALLWYRFRRPAEPIPEWDTLMLDDLEAYRFGCRMYRVYTLKGDLNEVLIKATINEYMILDDNGEGDELGVVMLKPQEMLVKE